VKPLTKTICCIPQSEFVSFHGGIKSYVFMVRMSVRKVLKSQRFLISEGLTPLAEAITAVSLVAQGVMKSNMA
jgi:hypothetical protein